MDPDAFLGQLNEGKYVTKAKLLNWISSKYAVDTHPVGDMKRPELIKLAMKLNSQHQPADLDCGDDYGGEPGDSDCDSDSDCAGGGDDGSSSSDGQDDDDAGLDTIGDEFSDLKLTSFSGTIGTKPKPKAKPMKAQPEPQIDRGPRMSRLMSKAKALTKPTVKSSTKLAKPLPAMSGSDDDIKVDTTTPRRRRGRPSMPGGDIR